MKQEGWAVLDSKLRYIGANNYMSRFNNLSKENHVNKHISEVVGEKEWFELKPELEEVLAGETVFRVIRRPSNKYGMILYPIKTSDWSQYWVHPFNEDSIKGVIISVWDLSERSRPIHNIFNRSLISQAVFKIRMEELLDALLEDELEEEEVLENE